MTDGVLEGLPGWCPHLGELRVKMGGITSEGEGRDVMLSSLDRIINYITLIISK